MAILKKRRGIMERKHKIFVGEGEGCGDKISDLQDAVDSCAARGWLPEGGIHETQGTKRGGGCLRGLKSQDLLQLNKQTCL
jgi:hypothetical protein